MIGFNARITEYSREKSSGIGKIVDVTVSSRDYVKMRQSCKLIRNSEALEKIIQKLNFLKDSAECNSQEVKSRIAEHVLLLCQKGGALSERD